jgi:hypothetical protein
MNVKVSVNVFPAPGLSIERQRVVNTSMMLFHGKTIPITNISSTAPISNTNLINLIAMPLNIPEDVVQSLMLLRVNMNGRELNLAQTFSENGVSHNNLLNVHLIAK